MDAFLRKILHVAASSPKDDDDDDNINSFEYSFAIEYCGPPIGYDVPRAVPVDIDQIPTAATVSSSSILNDVSLPIIQPIIKTKPGSKNPSKESRLGSETIFCDGSVTDSGVPLKGHDMVNESSSSSSIRTDNSGALGCADGDECNPKLSDGIESSDNLRFSDALDHLCEFPRSSEILELPNDCQEGGGFQDNMNPDDWESTGSGLISRDLSSEVFSCKGKDGNDEAPCHVKRPSTVTFRDPELSNTVYEESDYSDPETIPVIPKAERKGKKGSCYRCLMGNRFTEKEVCIVCDAKYCYYCALRAMGSMPEGRKCVTCIGKRINESKRGNLGKCSRLLKRLLTEFEVKQIMSSEISCKANQLPSQLIYVNGEPLNQEELFLMQTCANPPKNLKPGCYWYDKVSGFWGKEGQKPCQFISPQLNVGGNIKKDASNGNTDILINNREITKVELMMLKLAGVECEGKPHFWVSADGSYQEEGQNHIKGHLWNKTRAKLACTILSLPIPPDSVNLSGEEKNDVIMNNNEQKTVNKLLLVGYKKSGTSTIYKQAKLQYNVPFSEDERQNIKLMIQTNLYSYLGILLKGRERFEEEILITKGKFVDHSGHSDSGNPCQIDNKTIFSIGPRLKAFADWLLQVMASGNLEAIFPAASREYAPLVGELWKDAAIQATYDRRNELEMVPGVATYFLERAVEISRTTYEPSDMDILYAEGFASSNGLSCMEFLFPKSAQESSIDSIYEHDPSLRYQLIRVHPGNLGEHCKWLEMFEDVDVVLFCVSLTDYDEFFEDSNGVPINKMLASKRLFESIITHPNFIRKKFLLILNKFDLLEEKIERVPLTRCEWFHDFNPVISPNYCSSSNRNTNTSLAHRAFQYIAVKFKRLFHSVTDPLINQSHNCNHKLFVSQVTGLDPDTVDESLRYAREILKWQVEEPSFVNEISITSMEASLSS